jgi:hypothetical protein
MHLLQSISNLFIIFSNAQVISIIAVVGLLFFEKQFLVPVLLLMFTIILNVLLKSFFGIPFSPELVQRLGKDGFLFPSGHMQSSVVFYGWFLMYYSYLWLRAILLLVIVGIGFALVYEGYHSIYDVVGALFFGIVTIGFYWSLFYLITLRNPQLSEKIFIPVSVFCLSTFLIIMVNNTYHILPKHIIVTMWLIFGLALGYIASLHYEKKYKTYHLGFIIFALLIAFVVFTVTKPDLFVLEQVEWVFLASSLPFLAILLRRSNLMGRLTTINCRINPR